MRISFIAIFLKQILKSTSKPAQGRAGREQHLEAIHRRHPPGPLLSHRQPCPLLSRLHGQTQAQTRSGTDHGQITANDRPIGLVWPDHTARHAPLSRAYTATPVCVSRERMYLKRETVFLKVRWGFRLGNVQEIIVFEVSGLESSRKTVFLNVRWSCRALMEFVEPSATPVRPTNLEKHLGSTKCDFLTCG